MGHPLTTHLRPLGKTLRETLRRRKMSQAEFAKRIGIPATKICGIVYRHSRIDADLAARFEAVLGISAATWLRLNEEGEVQ